MAFDFKVEAFLLSRMGEIMIWACLDAIVGYRRNGWKAKTGYRLLFGQRPSYAAGSNYAIIPLRRSLSMLILRAASQDEKPLTGVLNAMGLKKPVLLAKERNVGIVKVGRFYKTGIRGYLSATFSH